MDRRRNAALAVSVALGLYTTPSAQLVVTETGALEGEYVDHEFGGALCVDSDRLLVTASGDNEVAPGAGAVFLYRRDGGAWAVDEKLTPPPHFAWPDAYGASVGASGETIIVGAPGVSVGTQTRGVGLVYDRVGGEWVLVAELKNPVVPGEQSSLGNVLAFAGDTAVFGEPTKSGVLQSAGAIYLFEREDGVWSDVQQIYASDQEQGFFGHALDIEEETLVVGAPNDSSANLGAGSVYVLERDGGEWVEAAEVFPNDPQVGMGFGVSVSLDGDRMLVGASLTDRGLVEDSGAAYVFGRDGTSWRQEAKLVPTNGHPGGRFGHAVHLVGRRAIVSTRPVLSNDEGFAHVFERFGGDWVEVARLEKEGGSHFTEFGRVARLAAGEALVNATSIDHSKGAVFVFTPPDHATSDLAGSASVWATIGGLPTAVPDPTRWARSAQQLPR